MAATLDRDAIARMIPHAGTMCLLDHVIAWDASSIRCVSARHRLADNPLRHKGRLGILSGIEFAAQAMAAHGRLAGAITAQPRAGMIASLRDIVCHADRLDACDADLVIDATLVMGDDDRVIYSFSIACAEQILLSG